jgi:hypothetical protein
MLRVEKVRFCGLLSRVRICYGLLVWSAGFGRWSGGSKGLKLGLGLWRSWSRRIRPGRGRSSGGVKSTENGVFEGQD